MTYWLAPETATSLLSFLILRRVDAGIVAKDWLRHSSRRSREHRRGTLDWSYLGKIRNRDELWKNGLDG
jgi:hypothetical protein